MEKLAIGKHVPHFSFVATNGVQGTLSDLKGQTVVLYFYPKDNTPGCTTEACDFNSELSAFNKLNVTLFGVSRDSLTSHEKFKAKYHLKFELISDPNSTLCNLFHVINEKSMYGKIFKGIERSTFIIDKNGILRYEWRKVKVTDHIADVLAAVKQNEYT